MYIQGSSKRSADFWSKHLKDLKENDRAEIIQTRGLAAGDLAEMMREMQQDAALTKCQNFMYIASFNPCPDERLTEQQWDRVYEIFEKHRGIPEGQQRIVVEHEKHGRIHRHIVWNRIDLENMRAFPDGLDLVACEAAEHEIERKLGLRRTPHFLDRDPGAPPIEKGPKSWEMFRGMKSGLPVRDVAEEVKAIYRESKNAADLIHGLRQHGYEIVTGKRAFLILDEAGQEHSLPKRLSITTKELRAYLQNVDLSNIPTVEQAKAAYRERNAEAEREADSATVKHLIEWEEKLAQAAIQKQQELPHDQLLIRMYRGIGKNVWTAKQGEALFFSTDPSRAAAFGKLHYVDVTAAEMEKFERPHSQRILQHEPIANNDWRTADPAIIARLKPLEIPSRTHTNPDLDHDLPKLRSSNKTLPLQLGHAATIIREAYSRSENAHAFKAAIENRDHNIARVTADEARWIHRSNPYLNEPGKYVPRSMDIGEYVILDRKGRIYQLTSRNTSMDRASIKKFMSTLDAIGVPGIDETRKLIQGRAEDRELMRQAFRDMSRVGLLPARKWDGRGRNPQGRHGTTPGGDSLGSEILAAAGKPLEFFSNAFESLFGAKLSPEQKYEADQSVRQRYEEGAQTRSLAEYLAQRAAEQRQPNEDRAEAQDRQRGGRER